jgi:outer membrane protein TolC
LRKLAARVSCVVALLLVVAAPVLAADAPQELRLDEKDVLAAALTVDPHLLAAQAQLAVAESRRIEAANLANPRLSWEQENFPSGAGEREDALVVSLPLDLSGRPATRRHLADAGVAAGHADLLETRSRVAALALRRFYELAVAERCLEVEERFAASVEEARRIAGSRRDLGEGSGLDAARMTLEAELAGNRAARRQAERDALAAELALRLGLDAAPLAVDADLTPNARLLASPDDDAPTQAQADLDAAEAAAARAEASAAWNWVPGLTLNAGPRWGDGLQDRDGYVVGVSVELPFFARGRRLAAEAGAANLRAAAAAAARRRDLEIARASARRTLIALGRRRTGLAEDLNGGSTRIAAAALAAWREGESSLADLLDTARSLREFALDRLELALAIKQAEITLRAANGEFQ